jgi:hypothetical protein
MLYGMTETTTTKIRCQFCKNAGRHTPATHYRRHAFVGTDDLIYIPLCESCGVLDHAAARVPLAEVA